jgi:hypothetical protein
LLAQATGDAKKQKIKIKFNKNKNNKNLYDDKRV